MNKLNVSEFKITQWKEYALYTLSERAIPNMIDGFKPSQRFILYSTIKNAKDRFTKINEIAGSVSSLGYHHGEQNASSACVGMAAAWNNNIPFLEGRGSFGTRLVTDAASPRYIFAKLHKNFNNIFTDFNVMEANDDPDIKTPKYYLPIIPTVLLNGIQGTATGYATNILPYDIKDIIKLCKDHLNGKDISKKTITPSYPNFKGKVEPNDKGGYDLVGNFTLNGKTKLIIDEIPFQYDREEYVKVLDDLEEKGIINDYIDQCSKDGFKFTVTLKRDFSGDIEKVFKLRRSVKENLNVIDHENKLREYSNPIDLIKDFCDIRRPYVQKRIDTTINDLRHNMALILEKIKFIKHVIDGKVIFKNKNKNQLTEHLLTLKFKSDYIDTLLSMSFYHLTVDEIKKLEDKYATLEKEMIYFKGTTATTEYLIDLDRIAKEYK